MAKKNNKGWIIVHRQILDSEIWNAEDPFSFRDAWIDLLLRANHADRGLILKNGTRITVDRGQHWTSMRTLATRWKWGNKKVLKYLDLLQKLGMISVKKSKDGTLITITNYDFYQDLKNVGRNAPGNAGRNAGENAPDNAGGNATDNGTTALLTTHYRTNGEIKEPAGSDDSFYED